MTPARTMPETAAPSTRPDSARPPSRCSKLGALVAILSPAHLETGDGSPRPPFEGGSPPVRRSDSSTRSRQRSGSPVPSLIGDRPRITEDVLVEVLAGANAELVPTSDPPRRRRRRMSDDRRMDAHRRARHRGRDPQLRRGRDRTDHTPHERTLALLIQPWVIVVEIHADDGSRLARPAVPDAATPAAHAPPTTRNTQLHYGSDRSPTSCTYPRPQRTQTDRLAGNRRVGCTR